MLKSNVLILIVLATASIANASVITHKNCLIAVGSSARVDVVDTLTKKGYLPVLTDQANEGELDLDGGASCRDELGVFKWQVCYGNVRLYSINSDRKVVVAVGQEKKELNFELTNRYPRIEALIGAIQKLPNCIVGQ